MLLKNSFTLAQPPDHVFEMLLDLERVSACMPGAKLSDRSGDDYTGTIRLKVGPIRAAYEGTVSVKETDPSGRQATLLAAGRELDGHGSAEAEIRARVVAAAGGGSDVQLEIDLNIQGRAAQFGRGVLGEVTQRVIDQFAQNLESDLAGLPTSAPATSAPGEAAPIGAVAERSAADDSSLDAWQVVVLPQLKRSAPQLAAFAVGLVVGMFVGRSRHRDRYAPQWGPEGHYYGAPRPWV